MIARRPFARYLSAAALAVAWLTASLLPAPNARATRPHVGIALPNGEVICQFGRGWVACTSGLLAHLSRSEIEGGRYTEGTDWELNWGECTFSRGAVRCVGAADIELREDSGRPKLVYSRITVGRYIRLRPKVPIHIDGGIVCTELPGIAPAISCHSHSGHAFMLSGDGLNRH